MTLKTYTNNNFNSKFNDYGSQRDNFGACRQTIYD